VRNNIQLNLTLNYNKLGGRINSITCDNNSRSGNITNNLLS